YWSPSGPAAGSGIDLRADHPRGTDATAIGPGLGGAALAADSVGGGVQHGFCGVHDLLLADTGQRQGRWQTRLRWFLDFERRRQRLAQGDRHILFKLIRRVKAALETFINSR